MECTYRTCKLWIAERIPSSRALTARDEATVATGPTILLFFTPPVLLIDPFFSIRFFNGSTISGSTKKEEGGRRDVFNEQTQQS